MDDNQILNQIKTDLANKKVRVEARDTHRVYTDGTSEVIIADKATTLKAYYDTFINPKAPTVSANGFKDLPRVNIYVGPPDTGKTYAAQEYCKANNLPYLLIMARDDLTLETLLEDFTVVNGQPCFNPSLTLKYLSGTNDCVIIIDEFNTLKTGVMKTLQPILDSTSTQFEYKGTIYTKNPNCKFIFTLNDKDKGISVLPDAILSRSAFKYFNPVDNTTLVVWTGYSMQFVEAVDKLYTFLKVPNIFGTRQLRCIHALDKEGITNHLKGLLAMKGMDFKCIDTPEVQTLLTKLIGVK